MFKSSMQYFVKTHLFDNVSFELLSSRRSFYLVKRSEFDYTTNSLHRTHPLFHIIDGFYYCRGNCTEQLHVHVNWFL